MNAVQFSSVAQSCLTLWPPCPSPTPRVHSDSCPSRQWCHPAISSSVVPFSSCPQSSQHQSVFQWVNSWHEMAKVLEFQLQHHSFQRNPRDDLLQNGLIGSPCSPRDSQESSPTPQFKSINAVKWYASMLLFNKKSLSISFFKFFLLKYSNLSFVCTKRWNKLPLLMGRKLSKDMWGWTMWNCQSLTLFNLKRAISQLLTCTWV